MTPCDRNSQHQFQATVNLSHSASSVHHPGPTPNPSLHNTAANDRGYSNPPSKWVKMLDCAALDKIWPESQVSCHICMFCATVCCAERSVSVDLLWQEALSLISTVISNMNEMFRICWSLGLWITCWTPPLRWPQVVWGWGAVTFICLSRGPLSASVSATL